MDIVHFGMFLMLSHVEPYCITEIQTTFLRSSSSQSLEWKA